jgi:hypothetical protein
MFAPVLSHLAGRHRRAGAAATDDTWRDSLQSLVRARVAGVVAADQGQSSEESNQEEDRRGREQPCAAADRSESCGQHCDERRSQRLATRAVSGSATGGTAGALARRRARVGSHATRPPSPGIQTEMAW